MKSGKVPDRDSGVDGRSETRRRTGQTKHLTPGFSEVVTPVHYMYSVLPTLHLRTQYRVQLGNTRDQMEEPPW